jgi:hypothetical protein
MRISRWLLLAAMAVGLVGFAGSSSAAQKAKKSSRLALSDLPLAAQRTLQREVGSGKIVELLRKSKKGQEYYHADVRIGRKEGEIEVAPDGTLLRNEVD